MIQVSWPRDGLDLRKPAWVPPGVSTREEARRQCGATEKAQAFQHRLQVSAQSGIQDLRDANELP